MYLKEKGMLSVAEIFKRTQNSKLKNHNILQKISPSQSPLSCMKIKYMAIRLRPDLKKTFFI